MGRSSAGRWPAHGRRARRACGTADFADPEEVVDIALADPDECLHLEERRVDIHAIRTRVLGVGQLQLVRAALHDSYELAVLLRRLRP